MKKIIIGVLAAALIAIPATAFAAQSKAAANCCAEYTAPCCTVPAGSSCCN